MNILRSMSYLLTPDDFLGSIYDITPAYLKKYAIEGVILDMDNTLLSRHETIPSLQCLNWVEEVRAWGVKLCILTNNTRIDRIVQVSNYLDIPAVMKAYKPLPLTVNKVLNGFFRLPPRKVAIVGDQFLTDIVCGKLRGLRTIYVEPAGPEDSQVRKWFIDADKKIHRFFTGFEQLV